MVGRRWVHQNDTDSRPYRQMLLDYFAELTARSVGDFSEEEIQRFANRRIDSCVSPSPR